MLSFQFSEHKGCSDVRRNWKKIFLISINFVFSYISENLSTFAVIEFKSRMLLLFDDIEKLILQTVVHINWLCIYCLTCRSLNPTKRSIPLQHLNPSPRIKIGHISFLLGCQNLWWTTTSQTSSEMCPDGSVLTIALVPAQTDLVTLRRTNRSGRKFGQDTVKMPKS